MSLPDQKYINHVRDALWSRESRASVMVGSGFSKNAQPTRPDAGDLPLWQELARKISEKMYPSNPGVSQDDTPGSAPDPNGALNLAQEYTDAFGRSSFHLFLQQQVRDGDFSPGKSHSRLLKLPWRDVFTTNWDTLLERTRLSVHERPYSIVHNKDEIPISAQPRIVKLNGSLDGHYPLVATEKDYSNYPEHHAPFVNTVQQAMMETVFLLIGFSGDDPNFLKWSCWVRKNLREAAPRIFLAGYLNLSADERDRLRKRNVVAIDLACHPEALQWPEPLRHKYATDWILSTLEGGRPYDIANWPTPDTQRLQDTPPHLQPVEVVTSDKPKEEPWSPPRPDDSQSLEDSVHKTLKIWRHNRCIYPGWLMAPLEVRSSLISITRGWETRILQVLNGLSTIERLNAIRELFWRHEITLEPIRSDLESEALNTLNLIDCENRTIDGTVNQCILWPEVREAWREVALSLVTVARHRLDGDTFFERIKDVEQFLGDDPDVGHRIHHERCLWAAWSLDFELLDGLLADWNTENSDPMWMLRKAALLTEAGRDGEAAALTEQGIANIRRFPGGDRSVASPSREGWALWSAINFENQAGMFNRWNELASRKCDAYAEKAEIANSLSARNPSNNPPDFDLTATRVLNIQPRTARSVAPAYRAVRLSEVAGIPLTIAADIVKLAAEHFAASDPELAIRLVLRACNDDGDKILKHVLSRDRIAMVQNDAVRRLVADCIRVIDYGLPRNWVKRIGVAIEVLSWLVLRLEPESALETFDYALEFYCNRQHQVASDVSIASPLRHLLNRAWEALPKDQRTRRAIDLLGSPIVGLDGFTIQIAEEYPDPGKLVSGDPTILLPDRRDDNETYWAETVNLLLRALRADGEPRRRAATRLVSIAGQGLLNEAETSHVANALWSVEYTPADSLPEGTSLYDWAFLILPEPKPHLSSERFSRKWLSGRAVNSRLDMISSGGTVEVSFNAHPDDPTQLEDTLWNVGRAITGLRAHGHRFDLADAERKYVVDLISQWARVPVTTHPHILRQDEIRKHTLWALEGLTPILSEVEIPAPIGETIFEKLKSLTQSGTPAYGPIGRLAQIIPHRATELATWLRTGLASSSRDNATRAVHGLYSWLQMSNNPDSPVQHPTQDMVREVGLIIAARRKESLSGALQVATWLFDVGSGELRDAILNSASEGLDYLAEELRYDREHDEDVTDLRWRCVQLASSMSKAGLESAPAVMRWLELARSDPFPKVRHAPTDKLSGSW